MRSRLLCFGFASLIVAAANAQDPRDRVTGAASPATGARRGGLPARGPLPDPALLDGSTQVAEKKPEYGMLGNFEIPGDDKSKSDRVGGQQGQPGGGGQQQNPNAQQQQGGQGGMQGMPPGGMPQGAAGGAAGGQQMPQGGQPQPGGLAGGKPVDPSQANGQGGGTQVAELKTDEANAGGVAGEPGAPKPPQVAIGDPAMQIKGVANAPGVVGGAVPAGATQQQEKATGGSGKGGSGDNSNKGVEKGRVVPAGL